MAPPARLQALAGFRNLLVHGYAEVDDARVVQIRQTRLGPEAAPNRGFTSSPTLAPPQRSSSGCHVPKPVWTARPGP